MEYRNWSKKLLNKQLKEVKNLYQDNASDDLVIDIEALKILKKRFIEPFPAKYSFKRQIKDNLLANFLFEDFLEDIKFFQQMHELLNPNLIKPYHELDNSIESILSFTHDFYNSLDKDFALRFNEVFKERKDNLKFSNKRSITVTIKSLDYSYININRDNIIADYFNSIHEYGHAIADSILFRHNYYCKYPFIELVSLFMELIAAEELNETFLDLENDIISYKANLLDIVLNYSKTIALFNFFLDHCEDVIYSYNERQIRLHLNKYAGISKKDKDKILKESLLEKLSYTVPYLVAIELYYLYKEDKEKALYYLKELIKLPKGDNYQIPLLDRDIVINNNSKRYILEVSNELKKTI